MLLSMDGRVTGQYLEREDCKPYIEDYYQILEAYQGNNWICGRATFAEFVPLVSELDLQAFAGQTVKRQDFIADEAATSFAIALDPSGKLAWGSSTIGEEFPERHGDHVVTILSETVSDAYLAYLQSVGVSYIFAGQNRDLDVQLILEKLQRYFQLETFYLLGGGIINGAFAKAELIDEVSLVLAPLIEGNSDTRAWRSGL
nr:dihydrofolate reductase family protein [Streptococcus macacae]